MSRTRSKGARLKKIDQKECVTAPVRPPAFVTSEKMSGCATRNSVSFETTPCTCGETPVWIEA
jgi:hypothetical protein